MNRANARSGFNLVEVIACVMIIAGSLAIGVSMVSSSVRIGGDNRAKTAAAVTALTAAYDPKAWQAVAATAGILNGFYVVREATDSTTVGGLQLETIRVRVYEAAYEVGSSSDEAGPLNELTLVRMKER